MTTAQTICAYIGAGTIYFGIFWLSLRLTCWIEGRKW